ncbi:MAG TPA: hypothetical protein VKU60_16930, partial [Chloroflexota bacterium]|nr:hypothetical protein [Chloroflexota bacterium]
MRNGRRVYDADTHGGPNAEQLEPYLPSWIRERIPDLDKYKSPIKVGWAGEVREEPYKHYFRFGRGGGGWGHNAVRTLGDAEPKEGERRWQQFMGARFPTEDGQWDPHCRVRDMDEEGIDVQMIVPNGANEHPDPEIEMGFLEAEHRFLDDFCGAYPHRLKSMIVASARCVDASVREI